MTDPLIGTRVGEYLIEAQVGSGGTSYIYRARQTLLNRSVAVKVLRPDHHADPEMRRRLLGEAQAVNKVRHPGVIDIFSFGLLPDGRGYMVMEFLDGETLDERLRRGGPLPLAHALPLMEEVLAALAAAHAVGVVHRDLKPSNVFLARQGDGRTVVKLLDFGLAKMGPVDWQPGQSMLKASLVAGTPQYVSPEQARGLVATPRSDLYCFGAMLFEVLSGRVPFLGTAWAELIYAHANRPAPRLSSTAPGIPQALDSLVAQLLEKDPHQRPASVDAVRVEVERIRKSLGSLPTQRNMEAIVRPATEPVTSRRSTWQQPPVRWGALFAGLTVVGAAGTMLGWGVVGPAVAEPEEGPSAPTPIANIPKPGATTELKPAPLPDPKPPVVEPARTLKESPRPANASPFKLRSKEDRQESIRKSVDTYACRGDWKTVAKNQVYTELNRRIATGLGTPHDRETSEGLLADILRSKSEAECRVVVAAVARWIESP